MKQTINFAKTNKISTVNKVITNNNNNNNSK